MPKACEFSEFTYGYVFTEERQQASQLRIAPIFVTPHQEHHGGGYDAEIAGFAFVQFKRPTVYYGPRAKEIVAHGWKGPVYRMAIDDAQHASLLAFEPVVSSSMQVLYACPCFYKLSSLNRYYAAGAILSHSALVSPTALGNITSGSHHLSYTRQSLKSFYGYRFSDEGERVDIAGPEAFSAWVTETSIRPPMGREDLLGFASELRNRLAATELPGTATRADSTPRNIITAIARITQMRLDLQTFVIERADKAKSGD